ncbi:phosphate ABC transporter substrate-binding protein PstS [Arachidicoccus ginsenosidivorans]|jgi:phosphate transport system substrate-binding protein|uniref:Phosphate-binding protein n=1 Tax=Arachidicoccus ginsenosidivorans TaxID=496057 RepID=A0A5B8VQH2_9BACT|nr:phosphate ABC transporter substrate-binding protein PstS [Arachidicoccus ginsenosidivorans]QEC73867.1 phosphate ABC transporter substrate-binding protein PstS [Arachidicoccus ginsenosidivorans]
MKNLKFKSAKSAMLALVAAVALSACGTGNSSSGIIGAGSSFDNPLFSKMFSVYHDSTKIQVNYQSVGSGAGISQLTHKTIDFGASDAPMNEEQMKAVQGDVLHIPVTAGAVVVSYNLPGFTETLRFTPEIVAAMFLGKIKKWNDPLIAAANPDVKLPTTDLVVAHRSDGSGTTAIFTSYLAKVSPDWLSKVGTGTSVNWPIGLGGKGNEGVSGLIKQTPGCVGYIELAYAIQNHMSYAIIQNKAGNYITPSIQSVTAAADIEIPADGKVLLTNTEAATGYPIAGFSWVLIYKEQNYNNRTQEQATQLLQLVNWMIHSGQQYSSKLDYAPLSKAAVSTGEAILKSATYNGRPILK